MRESTTLSSSSSQNGHFTGGYPAPSDADLVGMKNRKTTAECLGLHADFLEHRRVLSMLQRSVYQFHNLFHLGFLHPTGGDKRSSQSNPTGDGRRLLVVRHGILVHDNIRSAQGCIRLFACD